MKRSLLAAACMLCATMGFADVADTFRPLKSLPLGDGRTLVAGAVSSGSGYTIAVERLLQDGRPDPAFGADGSGIAQIPFWGYYEFPSALVLQPDGRILVAGNAADPILRDTPSCHPAFCLAYPVIARLLPDGALDTSFNGSGRLALAIGNANESLAGVQDYGMLTGINLDMYEGEIYVASDYGVLVAGVFGDGTLDRSFRTPGVSLVPREVVFARQQGLWYTPGEDGWRLAIAQQGNTLFGIWFLTDETGSPAWGSWRAWIATRVGPNAYDGRLYEVRGPSFGITPFDPSRVASLDVGSASLTVDAAGRGDFSYVMGSRAGTKHLTMYGEGRTCTWGAQSKLSLATNYDGHWWAAPAGSEPGWGLHLTHVGDAIQLAWMTYGDTGAPVWFYASTRRQPDGRFVGELLHQVSEGGPEGAIPGDFESLGSATLSFTDGNAGTFQYMVNGIPKAKAITRFVFSGPGTICSR